LKSGFKKTIQTQASGSKESSEVFTAQEIEKLPVPVRKYFETCGFIGKPKMSYMKAFFKNADFLMSADKPKSKIDYTVYTFSETPARCALIETKMFGIPFQGVDSYVNGKGGMKGVLAKAITLFNETGEQLDSGNLVNVLSECLIVPSIALQDYIVWTAVDDTHAQAAITFYGITVSGLFTFSETGELMSFTTNDRWEVEPGGASKQIPWSVALSDYSENNGIRQPMNFKAIWHYAKGDSVYFDGSNISIDYY